MKKFFLISCFVFIASFVQGEPLFQNSNKMPPIVTGVVTNNIPSVATNIQLTNKTESLPSNIVVAPETSNISIATNAAYLNSQPLKATHSHPSRIKPIDIKAALNRILQVKLPHSDSSSDISANGLKSMARTLNSLQPTFITGLISLSEEAPLRASQCDAFTKIRNDVLAANPRCKFDVVIHVGDNSTSSVLLYQMEQANQKIMPDIFLIRVSNNESIYPLALAKAVEFAHDHGQSIGYQGPTSMIPDGVDFVVLHTENGLVRREEVSAFRSKHHLPLLVHLSYHEQKELSQAERIKILTHFAEEQFSFGYHLIYPLSHPIFQNDTPQHAAVSNSLLVAIKALMARYN